MANPKVIPSLPFYYQDDTTSYTNVYDSDFDSCHSSGPDTVFQYTPIQDVVFFSYMLVLCTNLYILECPAHVLSYNQQQMSKLPVFLIKLLKYYFQAVNVSLCGANTDFDTLLSVYEKTGQTVRQIACNDDGCNAQSMLPRISLQKGRIYVIVGDSSLSYIFQCIYNETPLIPALNIK